MEDIGVIFLVCLAFAIAILIWITCCFFKVNGKGRSDQMSKSGAANRLHEMEYNKTNSNRISSHQHNVILFLNKKDKYANDSKNNAISDNRNRRRDGDDDIIDNFVNGGDIGNDIGLGKCSENNHQALESATCHQSHGAHSNGGFHQNHDSKHDHGGFHQSHSSTSHDHGHVNDGFSSHFSSHGGGWGHHSADSGHFGHDSSGFGYDGGNGDDGDD